MGLLAYNLVAIRVNVACCVDSVSIRRVYLGAGSMAPTPKAFYGGGVNGGGIGVEGWCVVWFKAKSNSCNFRPQHPEAGVHLFVTCADFLLEMGAGIVKIL